MEKQNKRQTELLTGHFRDLTKVLWDAHKVEGYLLDIEGIVLYAYSLLDLPGEIIEIGSFKGKSTSFLAMGIRDSKKKSKVFAIDPHKGSKEHQIGGKYETLTDTYKEMTNNLGMLGLSDFVEIIKDTSMNVVQKWNKPVGLIFIDGSHEYDDVRNDLRYWMKFVPKGGVICIHDSLKWEGPKAVCEEFLIGNPKFSIFRVGSMLVAFRKI